MKRRIISVLLAATMCGTLLAGCGGNSKEEVSNAETTGKGSTEETKDKGEPVTLRLWGGVPIEAGYQEVVDNFNEEFKDKGIQIEYERYVNDDQGNLKLETNLLAGSDIDIYVNHANFRTAKRAEGGMALDLTDLIARDNFDYEGMCGADVQKTYVDGKPYSIATGLGKGTLLVNKDMFEEAGIEIPTEWTFNEFREACKKLTHGEGQDKVYGMFWNTQQNVTEYWMYLAMRTLGGDPIYKEGGKETNFDNEVIQKAAELVYNTMNVDQTAPTHVDSVTQKLTQESMFLSGHSAMIVGNWAIRNVRNLDEYPHDFKTAYVPYPVIDKAQSNYTYGGFGDELSINPKSEHVDEAWEFIKWYAQGGMLPLAAGGRIPLCNQIPAEDIKAVFGDGVEEVIDIDSAAKCIFPTPEDKMTIPTITTNLPEIQKVFAEETEAYFTDQKDLKTAFADAKTRSDELLK